MGTLEKVMQMKQQGFSESQIIQALKQDGTSPKEILESISQSKIKNALNPGEDYTNNPPEEYTQEMQPSMMSPDKQNLSQENPPQIQSSYQPASMEYYSPQQAPIPQSQEYPQQYSYQEYPEYAPQQSADIFTINEIAEQIVEEKNLILKKQIASFTKFKEEMQSETEIMNQRLSKIENNFNELQMAIIRKIGEYGQDIKDIAVEMHSTQDSFSKILNPLEDNIRELQKITGTNNKNSSKKSKQDFEEFLR